MAATADYVVLLGDVGSGKSTVVEKLTGQTGRSSDANESWTKTAEAFWATDGSLIVADTPGSNAVNEKLDHNIWIAHALNFMPVSKILIVVKAETRIDNVADNIRKYSDNFMEIPLDAVAVLVTHIWTPWTRHTTRNVQKLSRRNWASARFCFPPKMHRPKLY